MGWAQTLARPGGMITGVFEAGSTDKRLELLKAVRPRAIRFGYLMNATNPANLLWRLGAHDAARTLGIKLAIIEVKDQSDLADAFDRMGSLGVEALAVNPDPVFGSNAEIIAELARIHKLPTVFEGTRYVPAGGLFSFTNDYVYLAKRCASYVDQILKGAAPGDLAMEEGKVYKLLINLKTAKALFITIPPSVLARADEVID
jgi:putative ABC transport system substrate-binding protein